MRRHLASGDQDFDLYIHGSPEHVEALREVHGHHERVRDELRQKYGDAYDDFEKVRLELDVISAELHAITDHGVALDANFSKYGYSAHLRTRTEPKSSASSTITDASSDKHGWEAEKQNGLMIPFYRRPVVRQYFHKGLLWRAPESEEVASFELFVDLLYVGIIAVTGETAAAHPSGDSLLWFCITFIIGWKIWTDLSLSISWFESDDIVQRISVLFVLACLFGYTTNVEEAAHGTYQQLIAFFLAARLFGVVYFLWMSAIIPMVRAVLVANVVIMLFASGLWIGSIHVSEPSRQGLIWAAIVTDVWGGLLLVFLTRGAHYLSKGIRERLQKLFEFYPAINIEHKVERTNAFVTLIFGHGVLVLIYQNHAKMGLNAFYGKAILGLLHAFIFNWIYFEIDGINIYMHAIRRKIWSAILWNTVHLPFIMAFVLGAAALSKVVLAHDGPNMDPHTLVHHFEVLSPLTIHDGIRWFYCVGIGISFGSMGIISMTHIHKDIQCARLKKWHRLTVRSVVSIIIMCLPAAAHLNSLELISIVASLLLFDLIVELYGITRVDDSFFGRRRKKCSYWADCSMRKKELEAAVKSGATVTVERFAEKDGREEAHFEAS